MAARKNKIKLTETWKERIRVSMLLNRVNNHALGEEEMTSTQLDAAKFLLNKIISNAPTQSELSGPNGGEIPLSLNVTFK
jgi:hypothetical protein